MLGLHMRLPPAKRLAHAHMIARAARERTSSISQRLCLSLHLPPRRVFCALNSPDCPVAFFTAAVSLPFGLGAVSSSFVAAVRVTHKTRPRTIVIINPRQHQGLAASFLTLCIRRPGRYSCFLAGIGTAIQCPNSRRTTLPRQCPHRVSRSARPQPTEHGHLSIAPTDNAHTYHIPATPTALKPDPPNSQDSVVSTASSTFSAPKLPSSSSNLSTTTVAETDVVRPSPDNVAPSQGKSTEAPMPTSPVQAHASDARANAQRIDAVAANAPQTGDTAASPMPLASPVTQGFKRTADGSVKGVGTPMRSTAGPAAVHKRNKSMDTHSGRAIGEVRGRVLGIYLQGANAYAAIRPTQDASFLRNGQGAERVGEAIA
jgi:hypothetical protein